MDFTVTCPNDGTVEVSLEDVSTVLMRGSEDVEVVFECPICGTPIEVRIHVPDLLATAADIIEDGVAQGDADIQLSGFMVVAPEVDCFVGEDGMIDAYCEYFHRQLGGISSADEALAEIDGTPRSAPAHKA